MRILIRGGWIIGYVDGGHKLFKDGQVLVQDDRIAAVGHSLDTDDCDRIIDARDKIVSPGFIDTHVHSGLRLGHRLIQDSGRRDFFGQPRSHFVIAREGTRIPHEPHDLGADYTMAELLRNGITTILHIPGSPSSLDELGRAANSFGLRAYLGLNIENIFLVGDEEGRIKQIQDDAKGRELLAAADDLVPSVNSTYGDRVHAMLAPHETDVCTPELLVSVRELADKHHVPVTCHAAYNIAEFYDVVTRYRHTPIELLQVTGLLGRDLIIGHGNFPAENRLLHFAGGRDLELIAEAGATVAHSPVNLVRRGRSLDHWEKYAKAGVRMALGTDTWPRDMLLQMRTASYMGKSLSGSYLAAPAADVFTAATIGGADALQRPDLGRLGPGAKADLVILGTPGLRWGAVRDPVKSMVDCGIGDDVELVMIDGIVRMEDGTVPGCDFEALRAEAQRQGESFWEQVPDWDPLGRSIDEVSPWSFPVLAGDA